MNTLKWSCFVLVLALIGGTALFLAPLRAHQKLGPPGVRTHPLAGSSRLQVDLPERVLYYDSQWIDVDDITKGTLPPDTSYGHRRYTAPDGFRLDLNVVLMGGDRTSLHKPQFCLEGQGLHIDQAASEQAQVRVGSPCAYDLPVVKLIATGRFTPSGGPPQTVRAVYVYWYVADDALSASASGFQRMYLMAKRVIRTGVLQRWAYVSCLALCEPGQEDATFERIKAFIAASAPGFELYPQAPTTAASLHP